MVTVERIVALIESKGIEQQDFAKAIGVSKQAISEWKAGKTKSYKKHIEKIADYFNVSSDYLLGKTDLPSIPEELKGYNTAFFDGAFEGLDEKDIDLLKQMAIRMKKEKENT